MTKILKGDTKTSPPSPFTSPPPPNRHPNHPFPPPANPKKFQLRSSHLPPFHANLLTTSSSPPHPPTTHTHTPPRKNPPSAPAHTPVPPLRRPLHVSYREGAPPHDTLTSFVRPPPRHHRRSTRSAPCFLPEHIRTLHDPLIFSCTPSVHTHLPLLFHTFKHICPCRSRAILHDSFNLEQWSTLLLRFSGPERYPDQTRRFDGKVLYLLEAIVTLLDCAHGGGT